MTKTAASVLQEHVDAQERQASWDIFMSHAFDDKEIILGATKIIEDVGFTVYLDWRDDPLLDRKHVTAKTAMVLRERMRASKCLMYATTSNAAESKWMPWELGFKDGQSNRSAILPILTGSATAFAGTEFLGIYPYVEDGLEQGTTVNTLWVHRSSTCYVVLRGWLAGKEPTEH